VIHAALVNIILTDELIFPNIIYFSKYSYLLISLILVHYNHYIHEIHRMI